MSHSTLTLIDHVTSKGGGRCNEDLSGNGDSAAWMLDGATDVDETFRTSSEQTSAKWMVDQVSDLLSRRDFYTPPGDVFSEISTEIDAKLRYLRMPSGALPPACSAGLVHVSEEWIEASLVGDVYIYSIGHDRLLSDSRFGANEEAAVRMRPRTHEAQLGIADRRRGYVNGSADQWILANNADVRKGVKTVCWPRTSGNKLLLATDGFARTVETYGLYPSWRELCLGIEQIGLQGLHQTLRRHEETSRENTTHFKSRDDVCAAIYSI